ncbi:MAG: NAD(P)-binding domain-containing protein [Bacteroidales bacterium]|nr:NAD(P)-binding domain-containing protein [Bacteroidales bacterium]
MKQVSIGFIGGGRIARILLLSIKNSKNNIKHLCFSEIQEEKSKKLELEFPEVQATSIDEVMKQDIIFSTVHIPAILEIFQKYRDNLTSKQILVSVSPKLQLNEMSDALGGHPNIARFVVNVPTIIKKGFNPIALSQNFHSGQVSILLNFLGNLGKCIIVEESKLEVYSLLSAMVPTYFWFQIYEMQKFAESYGLTEDEIKEGITEMINGSIKVMFSKRITREEVLDLIPLQPMAEIEDIVSDSYEQVLNILSKKLRV